MKNLTKIFCVVTLLIGFAVNASAQSATASASAIIVTPLALSNTADLNFGNLIPSSASGSVTITAAASPTVGVTGGVILAPSHVFTAARFDVTGAGGLNFGITLPPAITISNGSTTMAVDTWNSFSTTGASLSAGGTSEIIIGAKLTVGANQQPGDYQTLTPFTVTVFYN